MALIKGKQIQSLVADKVVENASKRFITDIERAAWNAKMDAVSDATITEAGLMSAEDKAKLDKIAAEANKYEHPEFHPATMITEDESHRFVTDAEKAKWNDKYTKSEVDNKITSAINGLEWKNSVPTFADIATTYPVPEEGWVVSVDDTNTVYRYDEATAEWVELPIAGYVNATTELNGLMSAADKAKLDGIAENANNYVHPEKHAPSIITQDENNRFVTDAEKAAWDAKADATLATTGAAGLMSAQDKTKLNGLYNSVVKSVLVYASSAGAVAIDTGIKTDGTGTNHTKVLDVVVYVNGMIQVPGADKDYTISENASNEIVINWNARHFALDTDDEIMVTYNQTV